MSVLYHLEGRVGLLLALAFGLPLSWFFLAFNEEQFVYGLRAKPLIGRDPFGMGEIIERVCESERYQLPKVFIHPQHFPICSSFHKGWQGEQLIISERLMESLAPKLRPVFLELCMKRLNSKSSPRASVLLFLVKCQELITWHLPCRLRLKRALGPLSWWLSAFLVKRFRSPLALAQMDASLLNGTSERQVADLYIELEAYRKSYDIGRLHLLTLPPSAYLDDIVLPKKIEGVFANSHLSPQKRIRELSTSFPG